MKALKATLLCACAVHAASALAWDLDARARTFGNAESLHLNCQSVGSAVAPSATQTFPNRLFVPSSLGATRRRSQYQTLFVQPGVVWGGMFVLNPGGPQARASSRSLN